MKLHPKDLEDLRYAVNVLEYPSFAARITSVMGSPMKKALTAFPEHLTISVQEASRKAIEGALDLAIFTLNGKFSRKSSNRTHRILCGMSGAIGGFFGAPALAVELPITTVIMLRSIAAIARSEGEDLTVALNRLACIEVFALGGTSETDDHSEAGYYAVRFGLANSVSQAARYIAQRRMVGQGTPVLTRLVAKITTRFGATVSQKIAAQAIPAIGALGGASINLIFTNHFQSMAQGHFIVRRLERRYGEEVIKMEYQRLYNNLAR